MHSKLNYLEINMCTEKNMSGKEALIRNIEAIADLKVIRPFLCEPLLQREAKPGQVPPELRRYNSWQFVAVSTDREPSSGRNCEKAKNAKRLPLGVSNEGLNQDATAQKRPPHLAKDYRNLCNYHRKVSLRQKRPVSVN